MRGGATGAMKCVSLRPECSQLARDGGLARNRNRLQDAGLAAAVGADEQRQGLQLQIDTWVADALEILDGYSANHWEATTV